MRLFCFTAWMVGFLFCPSAFAQPLESFPDPANPKGVEEKLIPLSEVPLEVVAPEEPEIQEAFESSRPWVMGEELPDGGRLAYSRKEVVGRQVTVEGIAWGQPFGLEGQKGTISPHAGPKVVYQGGTVFVKGIDFTKSQSRGKLVRVTGILRKEPKTITRFGDVPGYYYIEATTFEEIEAIQDPFIALVGKPPQP